MNRKELGEIRGHFRQDAKYFTLERVLTAFVDTQRSPRGIHVREGAALAEADRVLLLETIRRVLNPNLGRQSVELPFRDHAFGEDGVQTLLTELLRSELQTEQTALGFLRRLALAVDSDTPYAVLTAYCTYSPPRKNKAGDSEDADEIFRYLVTALCPTAKAEDKLIYDRSGDEILREDNPNAVISKRPTDGFLFPVFSARAADVSHVLYYTRTPNRPNENLVEEFLECDTESTVASERDSMREILTDLLGDALTYETVTSVNEQLSEMAARNRDEDSPNEVTGRILHRMLSRAGVPEEKLGRTEEVFSGHAETSLKPERLALPKTVIHVPEIAVQVRSGAEKRVHLEAAEGRHYMVIDLDDAEIEVNGYDLIVPGMMTDSPGKNAR